MPLLFFVLLFLDFLSFLKSLNGSLKVFLVTCVNFQPVPHDFFGHVKILEIVCHSLFERNLLVFHQHVDFNTFKRGIPSNVLLQGDKTSSNPYQQIIALNYDFLLLSSYQVFLICKLNKWHVLYQCCTHLLIVHLLHIIT